MIRQDVFVYKVHCHHDIARGTNHRHLIRRILCNSNICEHDTFSDWGDKEVKLGEFYIKICVVLQKVFHIRSATLICILSTSKINSCRIFYAIYDFLDFSSYIAYFSCWVSYFAHNSGYTYHTSFDNFISITFVQLNAGKFSFSVNFIILINLICMRDTTSSCFSVEMKLRYKILRQNFNGNSWQLCHTTM